MPQSPRHVGQNGIYFESLTNIYFIWPGPNMDKSAALFIVTKFSKSFLCPA